MQSGRYLFATAPNGRETLGLWPALRQAAPRSRRGRGRGGAAATRQRGSGSRSVARQAPYGGPCGFVLHSLRLHPSGKGGAACLRDIPYGNVVSRWTLCEMRPPNSGRSAWTWPQSARTRPRQSTTRKAASPPQQVTSPSVRLHCPPPESLPTLPKSRHRA